MASSTLTVMPNFELKTTEPLRPFSPSCLDFTKRLSLEASDLTTEMAADEALVARIADVIASYRISGPGDRYKDVMEPKMLDVLRSFVTEQEPINMVIPAYPFKSPNHEAKVLGSEPDVGERMSLQHLNSIGARIQQMYPPGGHVTVVSDGACYNDLLGISDEEVFDYAQGLHRITERLGLKHMKFTDIFELLRGESSPTTAEDYARRVGELKEHLFSSFLPTGYNFDEDIKKDNNALSTYRGYIKFLESDLATFFGEKGMGRSASKKHSSKVARGMIERGKAFSALVASKSPVHVRLSIHASDNTGKLSVALLPHKRYSTFPVTPWHNTPYLDTTNVSLSLGRKPTDGDVIFKPHKDELGLNFMCADVPMYSITGTSEENASDQRVKLEPLYPFGLKIQVPEDTPITHSSLDNVTKLAKHHSPLIIEGLDAKQCAIEFADDIVRMSSEGLSLSIVHDENTASTSDLVQISTLQDASIASEGKATSGEQQQECLAEPLEKSLPGWRILSISKMLGKSRLQIPFPRWQLRGLAHHSPL